MFVIQRRPPLLSLVGLLIIGAGVALAVLAHFAQPAAGHHHAGPVLSEHSAHLVVTLGMAFTLAGVVIDGARNQIQRRGLPAPTERSHSHAHR
jgi:hypothetical protein